MANTKVTHTGTVVKAGKELVSVKIEVKSACSACHAKSMCAAHDMAEKIIEAVPLEEVAAGDPVVVEMEEKFGLKAVFYVFFIPFLLMVSALFISSNFVSSETLSALISLVILVPYFVILALLKPYFAKTFVFVCRKS